MEEKLVVKISADVSELKKGMKTMQDEMTNVQKKSKKFSDGMKTLAKGVVAAFSVRAIVGFGKKLVETTAELQAMDAQFEQIFKGTEGAQALAQITEQSKDLGIQGDRLKKSWNSFGGQFKGAGMDATSAMSATEKATRLAADSAAFYDKSLEDSSASIASFMKGNFAAGDAIGVFTNASQMSEKAMAKYGKKWQDLNEAEKQNLLLDTVEKTYEMNGAMGQASREADSYENVMGNLKATWDRFLATIGAPVLKVVLTVMTAITDAIQGLQDKVGTVDFSPITNALQWIKDNALFVVDGIKGIGDPEALSGISRAFYDFGVIIGDVIDFAKEQMPKLKELFKAVFEKMKEIWETTLQPVFTAIVDIIGVVWDVFKAAFPLIETIVKVAFKTIELLWDNVLKPVFDFIMKIVKVVVDKFKEHMPEIQAFFKKMADSLDKAYTDIIKPVFEFIGAILKWLSDKFEEYIEPIVSWIFDWFSSIYNYISDYMGDAVDFVAGAIDDISTFFGNVVEAKDNILGIFDDVKEGIKEKIEWARDKVKEAIDKIKGFFDFKWKLPELKIPKLSVSGGFSLAPPSVPKFKFNWNARGAIFKRPTVLANGQGVGDSANGQGSAPEVVAPLSDLKQMLGLNTPQGNTTINLNGNYNFRDKEDMDYMLNQLALAVKRK